MTKKLSQNARQENRLPRVFSFAIKRRDDRISSDLRIIQKRDAHPAARAVFQLAIFLV